MSTKEESQEDLPDAVAGIGGESDVVAERAGMVVRDTPRPIPVDVVEQPDPTEEEAAPSPEAEGTPEEEPTD